MLLQHFTHFTRPRKIAQAFSKNVEISLFSKIEKSQCFKKTRNDRISNSTVSHERIIATFKKIQPIPKHIVHFQDGRKSL